MIRASRLRQPLPPRCEQERKVKGESEKRIEKTGADVGRAERENREALEIAEPEARQQMCDRAVDEADCERLTVRARAAESDIKRKKREKPDGRRAETQELVRDCERDKAAGKKRVKKLRELAHCGFIL